MTGHFIERMFGWTLLLKSRTCQVKQACIWKREPRLGNGKLLAFVRQLSGNVQWENEIDLNPERIQEACFW